jgi:hypothetical protein
VSTVASCLDTLSWNEGLAPIKTNVNTIRRASPLSEECYSGEMRICGFIATTDWVTINLMIFILGSYESSKSRLTGVEASQIGSAKNRLSRKGFIGEHPKCSKVNGQSSKTLSGVIDC